MRALIENKLSADALADASSQVFIKNKRIFRPYVLTGTTEHNLNNVRGCGFGAKGACLGDGLGTLEGLGALSLRILILKGKIWECNVL